MSLPKRKTQSPSPEAADSKRIKFDSIVQGKAGNTSNPLENPAQVLSGSSKMTEGDLVRFNDALKIPVQLATLSATLHSGSDLAMDNTIVSFLQHFIMTISKTALSDKYISASDRSLHLIVQRFDSPKKQLLMEAIKKADLFFKQQHSEPPRWELFLNEPRLLRSES
jgi:hypothetical protein